MPRKSRRNARRSRRRARKRVEERERIEEERDIGTRLLERIFREAVRRRGS